MCGKHLRKKTKRAKKIPETQQLPLGLANVDLDRTTRKREPGSFDFLNPSPEDIFIGEIRLREYLMRGDSKWVIRLRELIGQSDLSMFMSDYEVRGRHAIHPVVMLGLIVYGIIDGKCSLRQLESLADVNLGAWWMCGGLRPDHSTIGKFINRFEHILTEEYFLSLTRMLVKKLRIDAGDVAGDGTIIEAVSCRFKMIKAEAAIEAAKRAKEKAAAHPENEHTQSLAQKADEAARIAEERSAKLKEIGRDSDKLKVSPLEPEAVNQKMKNGSTRPSYKPSVLANKHRLIVGQHVSPSDENASVRPMLNQYESIHGSKPSCAMFDAGYHNHTVLGLAIELDLNLLCPSGRADAGEWEKQDANEKFGKKKFEYDEERDVYMCPEGRELKRSGSGGKVRGQTCVFYRCKDCDQCKRRAECTSGKQGRIIKRFEVDSAKAAMKKVFENERARKAYSQRKAMVEPVFSELRYGQNLVRFHRRGLSKVRVEFSLHCVAYNLRRTIRIEASADICAFYSDFSGDIRLVAFRISILIRIAIV